MGLEYVDIFYSHRPDPETPLEETMMALDHAVKQGKALYVGISNYPAALAEEAAKILKQLGTPCLIDQPRYSMFERGPEIGLLRILEREGIGCIAFSQGLLTDKYLNGIPKNSRAAKPSVFLKPEQVAPTLEKVKELNEIAKHRGQSLAQMAIVWLLRDPRVTSVLVGASSVEQLEHNVAALRNRRFTVAELRNIELILQKENKAVPVKEVSPEEKVQSRIEFIKSFASPDKNNGRQKDNSESRTDYFKNIAKNFRTHP
jgi:L-glyceraldehyde 3-phosphate reductase